MSTYVWTNNSKSILNGEERNHWACQTVCQVCPTLPYLKLLYIWRLAFDDSLEWFNTRNQSSAEKFDGDLTVGDGEDWLHSRIKPLPENRRKQVFLSSSIWKSWTNLRCSLTGSVISCFAVNKNAFWIVRPDMYSSAIGLCCFNVLTRSSSRGYLETPSLFIKRYSIQMPDFTWLLRRARHQTLKRSYSLSRSSYSSTISYYLLSTTSVNSMQVCS